jgi:hypothetical protein
MKLWRDALIRHATSTCLSTMPSEPSRTVYGMSQTGAVCFRVEEIELNHEHTSLN